MKLQLPYALERTVVKVISFSCIRFELCNEQQQRHRNGEVVYTQLGGSCFQNLSPPFLAAGMPDFVCV